MADTLRRYAAAQFVAIGSEDQYLDREVLDVLPGVKVLSPGDHRLLAPDDPEQTVASHAPVVRALHARWPTTNTDQAS